MIWSKVKHFLFCISLITMCILLCSCSGSYENDLVKQEQKETIAEKTAQEAEIEQVSVVPKAEPIECEAEDTVLAGNLKKASGKKGFFGSGYVEGFAEETDECVFKVTIVKTAFYDLDFINSADGHKVNPVSVDGVPVADITTDSKEFVSSVVPRVYLSEGEHEISVGTSWGWIRLDKLCLTESDPLPDDLFVVEAKLSNPSSNDTTKRLMSYLIDNYGKKIITGQYCETGYIGTENSAIYTVTGKYPAMLGLDFTGYSPASVQHGSNSKETDFAIGYSNKGGIVTFCWHWTLPDRYVKDNWYSSFYNSSVKFDLTKALNGKDPEGMDYINESIDAIAKEILKMQDNDCSILFRPLHEAAGGWFWWGASGAESYIELYHIIYDRLTNEYGCNNIIWVWNGQDPEWYPGDEYVDIIGIDIYPGEHVYSSQAAAFLKCAEWSKERKIIALSENGCMFDPELAERDSAFWSYFTTWSGEFVLKTSSLARYGEKFTEKEMLKKVYESDLMITRDELPDLKTYPIRADFK